MITQYPAFISQNNISTLHSVTVRITNGRQNPAFQREQSSLHGKAPELLQNGHQKTHKKTTDCSTPYGSDKSASQQPDLEVRQAIQKVNESKHYLNTATSVFLISISLAGL
jgi:hypothetical protein